ncbi:MULTISPECIES: DUF4232 domain-containing protein [Kitasatospora]|nr:MULTISPECIES: DUF4232 domain-containing protein [Kitasatospora]
MHLRHLPAAVLLPALGLALTACAPQPPAPAGAAPAALPAAPAPAAPVPATTAAAGLPARAVRDSGGPCTADDLRATVSARGGERAAEQIELTNRSPTPCTMTGYPAVELLGDDARAWTLPAHPGAAVRTVTLAPNGSARVTIDYQPRTGRPGEEFKVTGIALTPPGGTAPLTFHWEGANPRPGTTTAHVGPVTAAP